MEDVIVTLPHPDLRDLTVELAALHERASATAGVTTALTGLNSEGGDPLLHGDPRLLARHLGHYLAAASVVEAAGATGGVLLDVGCGTGLFSGWLADRLGMPLHLADHDADVLAAAQASTGAVSVHEDLDDAPAAAVVTAMEVLEHIEPGDQPAFCAALLRAAEPGGLLVVSTPDESQYPGGWSGYAPHVGCVTAPTLMGLLRAAGAAQVEVHRLTGGPYDTSAARRFGEAVGNRAWTTLGRVAPQLPAVLERRAGARRRPGGEDTGRMVSVPGLDEVRVRDVHQSVGGSLIAVVRAAG